MTPPRTIPVETWNCNKCGQALPVPRSITDLIICANCMPHLKHLIRSHHTERPEFIDILKRTSREEGVSI